MTEDAVEDMVVDLSLKAVGNILRSNVNGIPTIDFSDRIKKWLVKDMATTVVVKLLGRNISYRVLRSRISNLWRPSQPFQLMDVENGYYLVVFGHYLIVQPWTVDFNSSKPFPNMVLVWIRFPGMLGFLYKRQILEEIGSLIGKVTRLDVKAESGARGRFARMPVFVDLEKPFESLPAVCFSCGCYGHLKDVCPSNGPDLNFAAGKEQVSSPGVVKPASARMGDSFGTKIVPKPEGKSKSKAKAKTF
ncbi:hypothetical protein Gogos_015644 [Gossypium gossypioides]|uniref:CCHC-type domain-containing protein n=1 Tax=Gossypium gossypioides TaxID=34282 RepID=A0A7J9C2I7_GOSGO|nr:hypothetical protein [Gossypium gossypioides]